MCIGGGTLRFTKFEPVVPGHDHGGGGGAPRNEKDDEEEEEEGCWTDLTAMPGARVSGKFGEKRERGPHKGLDIAVPTGTPVYAVRSGVVSGVRTGELPLPEGSGEGPAARRLRENATSTGNYVFIKYDNGDVGRYLHLKVNSIKLRSGDRVSQGATIGQSNKTGKDITGSHLHYDHNSKGNYVDPQDELGDC